MAIPAGFTYKAIGGLKTIMAMAAMAAAFAALMLVPMVGGTSGANSNAGPVQTYQSQSGYFPDGYVNQATTIEPPIATF